VQLVVSDHTIWFKHIPNKAIADRLMALEPNAPVRLQIEGKPALFRKMRDGVDGRPTPGIRPDDTFKDFWNAIFRERRGETIEVEFDDRPIADPYLAAVSGLLTEWTSKADADAYDDL